MHLKVKLNGDGQYHWTMLSSREDPQPVAVGAQGCLDPQLCRTAALQMLGAGPEEMLAVQDTDGHWRWRVTDPDGRTLAESPTAFDTAAACGYALYEVRHALGLATLPRR